MTPAENLEPTIMYTDGACRNNPGPGGWGVVLKRGEKGKELWGGTAEQTTNNRMEMTAAIEGLKSLKMPNPVIIYTDSELLAKGASEWLEGWKRNGWKNSKRKPVENQDLWLEIDRLCALRRESASLGDVEWRWVKGHAGDPENTRADTLANRGMTEALGRVGR